MRIENDSDFQPQAFGVGEVIIQVAFGVNNCCLTVCANQIRGMGEAFDEEASELHIEFSF